MNDLDARNIMGQAGAARGARWETQPRWAIVEVYGHRRFGARVTDVERYGARFLSCEVQGYRVPIVIELSPSAVFQLTPVTEQAARSETPTHDVVPPMAIPCIVEGCANHPRTAWQKECEEHASARLERERMEREAARMERERLERIASAPPPEPTIDLVGSASETSDPMPLAAACRNRDCTRPAEHGSDYCFSCDPSFPF